MLDQQLQCGAAYHSGRSRRRRVAGGGEAKGGTMSASTVVGVACCWISALVLVAFFPATAAARTCPGTAPTIETISYLERTLEPPAASDRAKGAAELKTQNIERMDKLRIAPQEADSIFNFHRKIGSSRNSSSRRGLVGSSPPTCKSKCGSCQPCKPVHVAIGSPHGVISETEYYPEVWRCQCGNRYYMP